MKVKRLILFPKAGLKREELEISAEIADQIATAIANEKPTVAAIDSENNALYLKFDHYKAVQVTVGESIGHADPFTNFKTEDLQKLIQAINAKDVMELEIERE